MGDGYNCGFVMDLPDGFRSDNAWYCYTNDSTGLRAWVSDANFYNTRSEFEGAMENNPEAAKLAGLNVAKIKILGFTCAGILVGISAILLAARSGSADSSTGTGIEFTGIIACVLSGVALKGGEGTLWKAIVAVFVLGVLSNGMQLINLGTYPQYIAKGIIMLVSLYLSNKTAKKA